MGKIDCILDLTPIQKNTYSSMRIEMLEEDLLNLCEINSGIIRIDKVYVYEDDNGIEINTFIRNTTEEIVSFDILPLVAKDTNNRVIAAKMFHIEDLKNIKPNGARPYSFVFENKYLKSREVNFESIIVERTDNMEYFNELELKITDLPKHLTKEEVLSIQLKAKIIKDQKQLIPIEFGTDMEGTPYAIILINNGTNEEISLQELPLHVEDAKGKKILSDFFKVEVQGVKPYSSAAYTIFFNDIKFNPEDFDLSSFTIDFLVR